MHEKFSRRNKFNFWIIIIEFNFRLDTYFYHCVILNNNELLIIQLAKCDSQSEIEHQLQSFSKLTKTIL